jgi:hypothetical protein
MVQRTGSYVRDSYDEAGSGRGKPLSIRQLYSQPGPSAVGAADTFRPERREVEPLTRRELETRGHEDADALLMRAGVDGRSTDGFYRLERGTTYVAEFAESPTVPSGGIGLVRPSENLRNAGIGLDAGLVQPGQSTVEATLHVVDDFGVIAEGAPIAELVVVPTAKVSR